MLTVGVRVPVRRGGFGGDGDRRGPGGRAGLPAPPQHQGDQPQDRRQGGRGVLQGWDGVSIP